MMIERYGEIFYVQDLILDSSDFCEPWDMQEAYIDGAMICGVFLQGSSGESLGAAADAVRVRGRFVTTHDAPVRTQMTIRRASDSTLFRLVGEAVRTPEQAFARLKVFSAQVSGGADDYE